MFYITLVPNTCTVITAQLNLPEEKNRKKFTRNRAKQPVCLKQWRVEEPSRILITSHIHPDSGDSSTFCFVDQVQHNTHSALWSEYLRGPLTRVHTSRSLLHCANRCVRPPLSLSSRQRSKQSVVNASGWTWVPFVAHDL